MECKIVSLKCHRKVCTICTSNVSLISRPNCFKSLMYHKHINYKGILVVPIYVCIYKILGPTNATSNNMCITFHNIIHKKRKRNVNVFTLTCDVRSPSPSHNRMIIGWRRWPATLLILCGGDKPNLKMLDLLYWPML